MTTWRAQASAEELARSTTWDAAVPSATVAGAPCTRSGWLTELVGALEQQRGTDLEVVLVDDASDDETPDALRTLCAATPLPLLALRTAHRAGPSAARNAGADRARAP